MNHFAPSSPFKYLIALALFPAALFAQTTSLSLGSGAAAPGGSLSIPLSLAASGGQPAGLGWTFAWDTGKVAAVSAVASGNSSAAGKTLECGSAGAGRLTCLLSGTNSTGIANGAIGTVTLTLASTASSLTQLQLLNAAAVTGAGASMASTGGASTITVQTTTPALSSLTCSPASIAGGASSSCTAGLSAAAPAGGLAVSLGRSAPSTLTVTMPNSVTIPAGSSSAGFTVQVGQTPSAATVTVSATLNSVSRTFALGVTATPSAVSVTVSPGSVTLLQGARQQFTASVLGTTNTGVTWSLASGAGSVSASGLYTAPATVASTQQAVVRAASVADPSKFASATVTLQPPATVPSPSSGTQTFSIWSSAASPAVINGEFGANELGVKFRTSVSGRITGIRFYKSTANTGTHVGSLWTRTGAKLASVTFTNETSSGWQQALFAQPVAVNANTTYVASYFAPKGYWSETEGYFTRSMQNGPLTALASGIDGANGVVRYGASGFPASANGTTNHWVDVVFQSSTVTESPATISLTNGTALSGGPAQLAADDGSFYAVRSVLNGGTQYTSWFGAFSGVPNTLKNLKVAYSGSNTVSCDQAVRLWNWTTNTYVEIDRRSVGQGEVLLSDLTPSGNPADYVEFSSGTGRLHALVQCRGGSTVFTANADLLRITYDK
jgi:Domain of unknown function (DUF4082)